MITLRHQPSNPNSLHWSKDNSIALATQHCILIIAFPLFQPYPFAQTAAHRLTLPHLLPPDIIQIRKPKSIHEIILPSKPNFQSDLGGFHCCRWSPIGFSRSNGCILATLSLGNQVSFFQEVKQAGIKNWAMTHHFGSSKEENVRVQSIAWSMNKKDCFFATGSKNGCIDIFILKDQTLVHQIEIKASDDGIEILEFSEWMQEIEEEEEEEVVMNERISNSQCTICLSTLKNELVFVLVQIDSSEQGDSKIGAKIDAHSETECRLTFRIDTSHFKHDTREISLIEYITTLQLFVVGKMSDVHLYTLKGECQFKVALHSMEVVSSIRFVESSRQLSLDTMDGHSYTITFDENDDIQIINNTLDFQSHLTQRGNKENQDSDREEDNNEEQEEIGQIYPRVYGSSTSHNNIFQVFVFKIGSHTIQTYGTLKDRRSFLKFSQNFCGKLDDSTMFGYFKGMVETDACNSTTLPFYTHSITQ